jgi:hypothetical protein
MPDRLEQFLVDVAEAKAECAAADARLIARLKRLSPEEFVRVPRNVIDGLTSAQYADIVKTIAPAMKLKTEKEPPKTPKKRVQQTWWPKIPASIVGIVVGLSVGLLILGGLSGVPRVLEWWSYDQPLVRSSDVSKWPRCARLTRWTDGCVYRVTSGLSWAEVAGDLDLPESYLRNLNNDVVNKTVPAKSDIIVWRERFPLQEKR